MEVVTLNFYFLLIMHIVSDIFFFIRELHLIIFNSTSSFSLSAPHSFQINHQNNGNNLDPNASLCCEWILNKVMLWCIWHPLPLGRCLNERGWGIMSGQFQRGPAKWNANSGDGHCQHSKAFVFGIAWACMTRLNWRTCPLGRARSVE